MKRESKADEIKIKELAKKYNLPEMEIRRIVHSQYHFIRETCRDLPISNGMTREEFDAMKTNFTIPAIGKMYASHFLYNSIQEKIKDKD